ncbi:MAG: prenyltransferase [Thermoproteota archaeon]|nr:MAG: prenyltransferase [Candidatus Korarchaeota archaeon]
MTVKAWLSVARINFLPLSIILVFLGTSIALYEGYFSPFRAILALIGLVLLHISVNVLNEYFDYKSDLDFKTVKTPFSGGSGVLPAGLIDPRKAYYFGILCFLLGAVIGVFFLLIVKLLLVPIILLGGIFVLFYTTHLARWLLGELAAGLGMGFLPVLGSYLVQTESYSLNALISSVPSGILVFNLLLLNEFPDLEADKMAGRRNLVISLGRGKASWIYSFLTIFVYLWIILASILGFMPLQSLISLITIPAGLKAIKLSTENYDNVEKLIPALGANVVVVLLTQLLLGIGYLIGTL